MLSLAQSYKPVLSTPFGRGGYREISPSAALAPYIRCFWSEKCAAGSLLVIPDTCMDIIFKVNGGDSELGGFFCALDESSYYSKNILGSGGSELFGIRFYAWTARLFSRRDFSKSIGGKFELEDFFDGTEELTRGIQRSNSFEERVSIAEKWLSEKLCGLVPDNNLLNAVDFIIQNNGTAEISGLCMHTAVSTRTLERLFMRNLGVSPKAFSSLIRYQLLWQDMLCPDFDVLDAVEKFGYSDQPHLLNDFKRRHLMNPKQAVEYAKRHL